jgi:hypothetical protein
MKERFMRGEILFHSAKIFLLVFIAFGVKSVGQDFSLSVNADIVSRYIWRGLNVNDQPNIQPSITFNYSHFQAGFWGSYGLTHQNMSDESYRSSQEIDTWIGYTVYLHDEIKFGLGLTDYYYPNGGIKIGNFNNYNNSNETGAHTVEAGLNITGPDYFPLTLSGYLNIYNDKGHNIYFQSDYSIDVQGIGLGFFAGAATGSIDNPAYYGTDKFNVINAGIKASKQIRITENFSLPVFCSYILNPQAEISYLVFGISL